MMSTLPITKALTQFDEMIDEMADVCHALKQEKGAVFSDARPQPIPDASTNHFTNFTVEELGASLAKMEGIFVLATTNEDGSPDAAIFVPHLLDETHLIMFLAPNRTRQNLERTGQAWGVYEVTHADATEKQQRYAGARMRLSLVKPEGETAEEFAQATAHFPSVNPAALVLRIEQLIALG